MQATCLVAKETEPPDGDKPVEWRLLTNLPVENLEQAASMIDLNEVVRLVARLGGFLARKGDGEPGVKTI